MDENRFGSFINAAFKTNQGLAIGEYHASLAPLNFLIRYAPLFKQWNVKYIFTEKFLSTDSWEALNTLDTNSMSVFFTDALSAFGNNETRINATEIKNVAKAKLIQFLNIMRDNNILIIGINNRDINSKHNVTNPNGRANSAAEMNPFMTNKIKNFIKNKEKFLVWAGAAHVNTYTTWNGEKIKGISEELEEEYNIFCQSFHIYEQNFFRHIRHNSFCNSAEYKLGDMQDSEKLYADKLIAYDNNELFTIPAKITITRVNSAKEKQQWNSSIADSQPIHFKFNEDLDSEPITYDDADSDPILPYDKEKNNTCNVM